MRSVIAVALVAASAALVAVSEPAATAQDKKAQPKFAPPKATKPDAATLKVIADKTEELRKAVAALKGKVGDDLFIDVAIHLKAAENIVRFAEWYNAKSGNWALTTLDEGLKRAKQAAGGNAEWRTAPGTWVVRAYRSNVDRSIQPYAVLLPPDFGKEPNKKWRLDVVLHGRDSSLTEAKFIATHNGKAPQDLGYIQLEVYGRGNNAYRWAGETDVFEAIYAVKFSKNYSIDPNRIVLRGFSMGGAGTWHLGLQHPDNFCVIGPGAGFTTTHGYIASLPKELPDYQEKCLRIYDAVDYVENAFNVPIVAYSGEIDAQKKAADNIENLLKNFNEPHKFTHLVAPGLAHQMPKPWQDKAEAEYRKYADKGRDPNPKRVRFVTYTPKFHKCGWIGIDALEVGYQKAIADATREANQITVVTENVRRLILISTKEQRTIIADGQKVKLDDDDSGRFREIEKINGKWVAVSVAELITRWAEKPEKQSVLHGPIDDAFSSSFVVVGPTVDGYAATAMKQFAAVWDKYFRGTLPTIQAAAYNPQLDAHLVLFGDPQSNPLIAKVLPKLPITWTKDKLVVNGVEYDPKTHVPVLIYPNPLSANQNYVVINSGHTFSEADLKGTNANLYPHLGDWAVIKPTPTAKEPAAYEVVAAGLFDEYWQFPKKK